MSIEFPSDRWPTPRQRVSQIVISNVCPPPVHGPFRLVIWPLSLLLEVVDLLLELLDLGVLTLVGSLLLPLFAHSLVQVYAGGEGTDDGGDEGCDDEAFLWRA